MRTKKETLGKKNCLGNYLRLRVEEDQIDPAVSQIFWFRQTLYISSNRRLNPPKGSSKDVQAFLFVAGGLENYKL